MSTHASFGTLSEFLLQAGTEYFVIDVSRTRRIIDNQTFFDYESNKLPFDSPRQGFAWLCVVFWNKQVNQEHYIWFLKLPIDEQSLLQQAARDQFLHIVSQALGQQLQNVAHKEAQLPENPFIFTPNQQLLADCNTLIRDQLKLPTREGAKRALNYLQAPSVGNWSELSVQDISDLAIDIQSDRVQSAFIENLNMLAQPVCTCLFSSFEGLVLPEAIEKRLLDYHQQADKVIAPMALRALASCRSNQVNGYVQTLISGDIALDTETLVVIAGRHWQALSPELSSKSNTAKISAPQVDWLAKYFEKVAQADDSYALFKGIFADMVQIPAIRVFLLAMLRQQGHCEALQLAITSLFEAR